MTTKIDLLEDFWVPKLRDFASEEGNSVNSSPWIYFVKNQLENLKFLIEIEEKALKKILFQDSSIDIVLPTSF